jgi:hypothetical protein
MVGLTVEMVVTQVQVPRPAWRWAAITGAVERARAATVTVTSMAERADQRAALTPRELSLA